ncbi:hypothetical protein TNCV_4041341 [Trichonephila clavipes]|nr:hypothetical protein TNCV_4041341 [Trichonephila clavipes]
MADKIVGSAIQNRTTHHGPLVKNGHDCSPPSIHSYSTTTFAEAWVVSKVVITSTSLDNATSEETNPDSSCSILMAVYVSGGYEETARHMLASDIGLGTFNLVRWFW